MTDDTGASLPSAGFHAGELAIQRRAGVAEDAARLAGMLAPTQLRGGIARFLADRTFAALTGRDAAGRLWISPLFGPAGFLDPAAPARLVIHSAPAPGDPLHGIPNGQPVGLLVIEFGTRRRVRINGELVAADATGLRIDVEQAYGNCPQYIQQRDLEPAPARSDQANTRKSDRLEHADTAMIRGADTFFIGTAHPTHGADASHRGGPPGFVRVEQGTLWWPEYHGNNMFNTLGNIVIDPAAALLFADFGAGRTLHLSGEAVTEWTAAGIPGDDDGTGRRVRFTPRDVVSGRSLPFRASPTIAYPRNPPLTDGQPTERRDTGAIPSTRVN